MCAQDDTYFQQQVDYKIDVQLNDQQHQLQGQLDLLYTNHSPDTLSYIYFHLWPNAYKHQQTDFAQQLLNQNRLDFHFSKAKDRGSMDSLDVTCNGISAKLESSLERPDIAKLILPEPLAPNASVRIKTPFKVKIPSDFSRLAHVDQQYMLCQWYPKPAVYDHNGWHPMPYLDQGEFYSEFGSFDVQITLPKNYVVAATGTLQTVSEHDFLAARAQATAAINLSNKNGQEHEIPASSDTLKTIRFTAEQVHDFAWFADKRYYVLQDSVRLEQGNDAGAKWVKTYAMFTNNEAHYWKYALDYTKRALQFYSNIVGTYPYETATVVEGWYKGCDMEYPTVTVIGPAGNAMNLDNVITHEVGHNWFYGILGSNERDFPWMDEGLNTYLDARYMTEYYSYEPSLEYLSYLYEARKYTDQPINSRSQDLSVINYYNCAYGKPTLSFRYLQAYLGTEQFDQLLQQYYQTWKFKHPQPEDLRAVFEANTSTDLAWFFDHVIDSTTVIDYGIKGHSCCAAHGKGQLTIKNKGSIEAPFPVSTYNEDKETEETIWISGIPIGQDTTINLGNEQTLAYHIDAAEVMPEWNRNDNVRRTYGLGKQGKRLRFKFLGDFDYPDEPRLNFLPLIGGNWHDGFMLGGAFYNLPVPERRWNYAISPFFATGTLQPVGMGRLEFREDVHGHYLSMGLNVKSFHRRRQQASHDRPFSYQERFIKIVPYAELKLKPSSDISPHEHKIYISHAFIIEQQGQISFNPVSSTFNYEGLKSGLRSTHRLGHWYKNKTANAPFTVQTQLEYANYEGINTTEHYLKLTTEADFKFYYSKRWAVDLRLFAGGFLFHTNRRNGQMPLHLIANHRTDYHYDHHIMGRNVFDNVLEQQVVMREGGFKVPVENAIDNGYSNNFIFAINFEADLPFLLPIRTKFFKIKPFVDLGYFSNTEISVQINGLVDELFVSGGLMLDIWDGALAVYVPLVGTENLENKVRSFSRGQFLNRITFSFNLSRLEPHKLVESFAF